MKLKFKEGEKVWFVKSMRMCRVIKNFGNGSYIVARLDNDKRLFAMFTGLAKI